MDKFKTDGYRKYIWKYFKLHANQRIALFRFYVVFFSLFAYAIAHLIIAHYPPKKIDLAAILILSVFFMLITYIFSKLDERNKNLLHNAEDFFEKYEARFNDGNDDPYQLDSLKATQVFSREKQASQKDQSGWRHTKCFRWIFIAGGLMSSIFLIYSFLVLVGLIPKSFFC